MIKFVKSQKSGRSLVGLGLEAGNIERLKNHDPMLFSLEELGIEGVDIMIVYGDTQEDVKKEITAQGFTLPQNKEQA